MFVETDPVVTQLVEQFPRIEVLGVRFYRDFSFKMLFGERIRQLFADPQMFEVFTIGQEIENEDLHSPASIARLLSMLKTTKRVLRRVAGR